MLRLRARKASVCLASGVVVANSACTVLSDYVDSRTTGVISFVCTKLYSSMRHQHHHYSSNIGMSSGSIGSSGSGASSIANRPSASSILFDATDFSDDLSTAKSQCQLGGGTESSAYHRRHRASAPVAAYTGNPFPEHATLALSEAARAEGFTSRYWLTSRQVRNKSVPLKPNARPVPVCLEGDGTPRIYKAYFVDDIHAEDLSLFMRDAPPLPHNADFLFDEGNSSSSSSSSSGGGYYSPSPERSNNNNSKKNRRRHNNYNNQQQHHDGYSNDNMPQQTHGGGGGGGIGYTPIVYVLHHDRWRCPGNTACTAQLDKWVRMRRHHQSFSSSDNHSASSQQQDQFPPVFLSADYVRDGNMRIVNGKDLDSAAVTIEDSTQTLFYNADQTLLPPHTVVPVCGVMD